MTGMIEANTADLIGLALNYAVGIADGRDLELPSERKGRTSIVWCDPFVIKREGHPDFHDKTRRKWEPSTDWSHGGPLIEKYLCQVVIRPPYWEACALRSDKPWVYGHGETALVAACRAIVADKLGEVVIVPKELLP